LGRLKKQDYIYCHEGRGRMNLTEFEHYKTHAIYQVTKVHDDGGVEMTSLKDGKKTRINGIAYPYFFAKLVVL